MAILKSIRTFIALFFKKTTSSYGIIIKNDERTFDKT